jgi:CDGSH-type Zn-finger protein/uncharacterized Fe-S cluster protein YjdI
MARIKHYEGDGIQVTYDADRCIHAAECVRGLPRVFAPDRRPWIDAGAAGAEEIAAVVARCPTGALSCQRPGGGTLEPAADKNRLRVVPHGPIYASGDLVLLDAERREIGRESRAAFCRCGASNNKPYCDGTHSEAGFEDPGAFGSGKVRLAGEQDAPALSIRLRADGPLVLEGRFTLEAADGASAEGGGGALCRCGASKSKPFCDGSHREIGFEPQDPSAGS